LRNYSPNIGIIHSFGRVRVFADLFRRRNFPRTAQYLEACFANKKGFQNFRLESPSLRVFFDESFYGSNRKTRLRFLAACCTCRFLLFTCGEFVAKTTIYGLL
jgi:hypothetical protein